MGVFAEAVAAIMRGSTALRRHLRAFALRFPFARGHRPDGCFPVG
jgi:hypothetical protein